ncbi:hypothetical protein [Streptomyces sp. NPDC057494]|uniref:hypothetical protein n=1 Tax=Streptomyces sp. NPDC057494 TaxID=3346148 RepID=UPI003697FAF2
MPNSARSRTRSGRARRSGRPGLLLVPALLTALLAPLVPTGTALAATPPPAAGTAPAPAPATPAPEPSTTTDPTAAPATTAEPSPNPTAPADGTCPTLPLAPLNGPGDAVGRATLGPDGSTCFTVTVEKPGLHRALVEGASASLTLASGGTPPGCPSTDFGPCQLAAGTYRLELTRRAQIGGEVRAAVVPLMAGPACTDPVDTAFGTAPATGTSSGDLGIVCRPFTAAEGELISTTLREGASANVNAWITDDTGKRLCNVGYDCTLPAGLGGYRVLAQLDPNAGSYPVPYTLTIRQLSHPAGCAVVGVNAYGSAPTQVSPPADCKTFTPPATGAYDVGAVTASGAAGAVRIYAPTGRVCEYAEACRLTAGVTYTLVTSDAVRILDRTSAAEGCADLAPGQPRRDALTAVGEVDCVNLPLPRGARVAVLTAPLSGGVTPDVRVLDATGGLLCWTEEALRSGTCALDGPAPYRAVVASGYPGPDTGAYGLVVHRTDTPSDCRTFPAGDFGANPARVTLRTDGDVFADCLTIPAGDHSAHELMTIAHASGSSGLHVGVVDEHGTTACERQDDTEAWGDCALTPGLSYTVLALGDGSPSEHTLIRRDVTGTARGCVDTPATKVGAPSAAGVPAEPGTVLCHRVTTGDARDTLHLDSRYTEEGYAYGLGVYDAAGKAACEDFDSGCAVTGSTRYQAIITVVEGDTGAPAYRLDALRIGGATGPAPECARVPDVSYGFGPLTGTLSEERPALCAVLPTASNDVFKLAFTPAVDFSKSPTPWLYDGQAGQSVCDRTSSGYHSCVVPGEETYEHVARPTTLVIGLPSVPAQAPTDVRATASCPYGCGTVTRTVTAVSPGTVGAGKVTLRVTGAALHEKDVVEVSGGSYRARSTTLSVAPDRRSMDVSLDLTSAPRAALSVKVITHDGTTYTRGTVTVVAPLRATVAPVVAGTVVVGGKVTANAGTWSPVPESYAYQWRADGVAIAGATASAYTVPATLQGKQLSVAVTARKAGHPVVTAASAAVVVKGVAPKPTKAPAVSGTARVGDRVTAAAGTWSPAPTSYAYQWRADGVAISGATGSSYVPSAGVRGKKLTVTVTALRTGHLSGTYTTAAYTVVTGLAPKATVAPSLTGTVRVGRVLTLNRGTWTPAPTSYAYQWYANGRAISGATRATFTLTKTQRGTKITVRVTALQTGHLNGVAWTRSTGAVAG